MPTTTCLTTPSAASAFGRSNSSARRTAGENPSGSPSNGVPFFAKGANWIPADAFAARVGLGDYEALLRSAAAAHMNMLRVWGGGVYESEDFYNLCDELGLCVWQDFMFACSTYPAYDRAFLRSVRAEAEHQVRRLRHHACIALWCGNNELEQGLVGDRWSVQPPRMSWRDYAKLFDRLLPEVVRRNDPERAYWPCSPHNPCGDRSKYNNPACGDAHLWEVWHGRKPFESYRANLHRFCSEFGFQSFPEPRTVRLFTAPSDRNVTSYVMEHHQRSGIGNSVIFQYMLEWFRLPQGLRQRPLAQPDSAGSRDEVRRRALAPQHAADDGHALLAAQRLLARRELVFH